MREADSLACVGLDPVVAQMPAEFASRENPLASWGVRVIEQTHRFVCAFKLNLAFYEAEGQAGLAALEQTLEHLRSQHPDIPVIGDAKRGDIGTSSEAYARSLFDRLGFDAVTLNPYLGRDALEPFLRRADRGCIIVCRTSNPGADDFQTLNAALPEAQTADDPRNLNAALTDERRGTAAGRGGGGAGSGGRGAGSGGRGAGSGGRGAAGDAKDGEAASSNRGIGAADDDKGGGMASSDRGGTAESAAPLWHHVLRTVVEQWNARGNCLAVIGATRPDDLRTARSLAGDEMTFLVPGIGAQGGEVTKAMSAGVNSQGRGVILTSSRSITSASDPAAAAANLQELINQARRE